MEANALSVWQLVRPGNRSVTAIPDHRHTYDRRTDLIPGTIHRSTYFIDDHLSRRCVLLLRVSFRNKPFISASAEPGTSTDQASRLEDTRCMRSADTSWMAGSRIS